MKAALLTSIPSPHMFELVDAVNAVGRWRITPIYERYSSPGRRWSIPELRHEHVVIEKSGLSAAEDIVKGADLVVVGTMWGPNSKEVIAWQKRYGKPLVFWGERPGTVYRNAVANFLRPFLISRRIGHARAIWGIGQWAVEEYRRCVPSVGRYENMPYAIDISPYLDIPRAHEQTGPVRVLYSGALIERKGCDLLMKAAIRLIEDGHDMTLTLMGHGELEGKLRSMVPPKCADKIVFEGFRDWCDLPEVYARHTLLAAPSRYDGWGMIVFEGLAAGMPVIATDMMGSARDFIEEGVNGWVVPASDGPALYRTMKEALHAPLCKMGIAGRLRAGQWTIEQAALRWSGLADSVMRGI